MTIVNKIRDEKQQAARREQRSSKNISIIISKTDKYKFLTGKEILPSD